MVACDLCRKGDVICAITAQNYGLDVECYVKVIDKGVSWTERTKIEEIRGQLEGRLPILLIEEEPTDIDF